MVYDFVETQWFRKLWPLIMARYSLREDQAKVLTVTLALGKKVSVNEIKQMLEYFKGGCDRSRADTVAESLKSKGLFRRYSSGSRKFYKSLPYEDIWPEIQDSYQFLSDCKAIIEQNQETVNFNEEIEKEDMATFETEHDIVSYMRDLYNSGTSFVILRSQVTTGRSKIRLWQAIEKRLQEARKTGKLRYIPSRVNAIMLLNKKRPFGFIRLRKLLKHQGSPRFHGTKILDPELANIIYKKEVIKK